MSPFVARLICRGTQAPAEQKFVAKQPASLVQEVLQL
jgi:hypothetical protein